MLMNLFHDDMRNDGDYDDEYGLYDEAKWIPHLKRIS